MLFCLVEKLKSVMASKCFQLTITEHESVYGRNEQEGITPQVPSLDPLFAIFIDLCSCDFQAVGSFAAQVNN